MKIYVIGLRGFPGVIGGVEKHCEQLYPKIAQNENIDITVFARRSYFKKENRKKIWKNIKFKYFFSTKNSGLETILHTFFCSIYSIFNRPNIVHFHNIGPAIFIPLLKLFKIKTVLTYHSMNYQHGKWGFFAKLVLKMGEYFGINYADKIIFISKNTQKIIKKKYNVNNFEYITNGVEIIKKSNSIKFLEYFNLNQNNYIFTAARLVPEKGILDLINAFLLMKDNQFKLVIAGEADYENDYSRKIKKIAKKNESIILTGYISGEKLSELFSNAKLFVLPSYHEGLPIALLEAMQYNLSILASNIPGNKEVEIDANRYFKVGNLNDLKEKMEFFLKEPNYTKENLMYNNLIQKKYNWEVIAEKTLNIFKKC
jgi:glycosyltransferase involved in cell wall biosynthesis